MKFLTVHVQESHRKPFNGFQTVLEAVLAASPSDSVLLTSADDEHQTVYVNRRTPEKMAMDAISAYYTREADHETKEVIYDHAISHINCIVALRHLLETKQRSFFGWFSKVHPRLAPKHVTELIWFLDHFKRGMPGYFTILNRWTPREVIASSLEESNRLFIKEFEEKWDCYIVH